MQRIGYLADHARGPIVRTGRRLVRASVEGPEQELLTNADRRFERSDGWSSAAYFYLDRLANGLPRLAPVAQRTAGL